MTSDAYKIHYNYEYTLSNKVMIREKVQAMRADMLLWSKDRLFNMTKE